MKARSFHVGLMVENLEMKKRFLQVACRSHSIGAPYSFIYHRRYRVSVADSVANFYHLEQRFTCKCYPLTSYLNEQIKTRHVSSSLPLLIQSTVIKTIPIIDHSSFIKHKTSDISTLKMFSIYRCFAREPW